MTARNRAVGLLFALCLATSTLAWPLQNGVTPEFDCAVRKAAYAYGKTLLPRLGLFGPLYYALDLNNETCKVDFHEKQGVKSDTATTFPPGTIFVSPNGSDESVGTDIDAPIKSIQKAIDMAAEAASPKKVVLRGGNYFLKNSVKFTHKHSGVKIIAHPDDHEQAVVSGGISIKADWKPYDLKGGKNIFVANIKSQLYDGTVPGLQLNGKRATRARYPNLPGGIEVSPMYDDMIPSDEGVWTPPQFDKFGPVKFYTDNTSAHKRPNNGWFEEYMIGVDGLCSVYDPPVSYWCSQHPSGGGAFAFRTPSGVAANRSTLPHSPYADASQALLFVWRPARWANWMFEVADYDPSNNNFTFGKGGFQGARGNNKGGDFFIENVFEELDNPGEFFYNESTGNLYLYHNGTGVPPDGSNGNLVVPYLKQLISIEGTQWQPVTNVTHRGIKFSATRYTYMEPHGVPSAGDWALDRFGAIFLQGTEGIMFDSCEFDRLDGNGVMVSGYNRNATVTGSDFSYIGGNAIAAWGYTNETRSDPGRPGVVIENYPEAGVDGTDGNHPRYTTITGNSAREVGLYEKQSSFFVQAKTAQSIISGNVFFNGPRAGINFNDGFGGGDEISHNLVFSTCRESGDHGPFNSWDRQPFLTTVRTGEPSMQMAWRTIHHNFFIDNYSPQENVDNDDGSQFYHTHHNFLVYGENGEKSDFGGHNNIHFNNLYAYLDKPVQLMPQAPGKADGFYDNTVVMTGSTVGNFQCDGPAATNVHDNLYYTSDGKVQECNMDLKAWQAKGGDKGSVVAVYPKDADIITWAKNLLNF